LIVWNAGFFFTLLLFSRFSWTSVSPSISFRLTHFPVWFVSNSNCYISSFLETFYGVLADWLFFQERTDVTFLRIKD
jgi:hypothetical protein